MMTYLHNGTVVRLSVLRNVVSRHGYNIDANLDICGAVGIRYWLSAPASQD